MFLTEDQTVEESDPAERVEILHADMSSSRPLDRGEPEQSICVDDVSFVARSDGIWCRRDAVGRLYPVKRNGERCAKPKTMEKGSDHDQKRPEGVSPHVWWKMMSKADRLQWWNDHPDSSAAATVNRDITSSPMGVSALMANAAQSLMQVRPGYVRLCASSMLAGCSKDSDSDTCSLAGTDEESLLPWDQWAAFVEEVDKSSDVQERSCSSDTAPIPRMPFRHVR